MSGDQAAPLPPGAVLATAKVLDSEIRAVLDTPGARFFECNRLATLALAAGAPALLAAERERISEELTAQFQQVLADNRTAVATAERRNIVKWLYAESAELAKEKPGLTDQQRESRAESSRALITAIAHMSAYGMDGN